MTGRRLSRTVDTALTNPVRQLAASEASDSVRSQPKSLITASRVIPLAVVTASVGLAIWLSNLKWSGIHPSPVATWILRLQIMNGPLPVIIYTLTLMAVGALLFRKPTRRHVIGAVIAIAAGSGVAGLALWWVAANDTFGVYVGRTISIWVIAALAVVGLGVRTFWGSGWLRRMVAAACIVLAVLSATLGINAYFGLDPTLGDLVGITAQGDIRLPLATGSSAGSSGGGSAPNAKPVWSRWTAPPGMPKIGKIGSVMIPDTVSGFKARPAGVYLPPAALVANAPALPLVIMMMGQPGNPDASIPASVLDRMSAKHDGLAPIVVVADQIGNPAVDTLCLNTARYVKVESYITKDVVNWARTHLHVLQDPAHWTVAGYSAGGECAAYFGAKYPNIWGNVIDISGEAYAGSDTSKQTVAQIFNGNWAAYEKTWPVSILGGRRYADNWGVFTVSSDDLLYRLQATAVSRAARAAGWNSTFFEVPNAGHGIAALLGGLSEGFKVLYPRLGLSPAAG